LRRKGAVVRKIATQQSLTISAPQVFGDEQAKAASKKLECPVAIKDKRGNPVTDLCW
jgi:hypothetical protein